MINLLLLLFWVGSCGIFASFIKDIINYAKKNCIPVPKDKTLTLTTTDYGEEFASGISKNNIIGVQYHPERSGEIGIQMLKNFTK